MGARWLHDLPDVLAGVDGVRYWPGWETRSRSSGGFDRLYGIVAHHNACPPSQSTDAYCRQAWGTHPERPVGNLYLARDGEIIVGCAGASNCAGKGGPWITSKGAIPLDKANQSTINIEAGNNGVDEPWADRMLDRYVLLLNKLAVGYGFDPITDIGIHYEWAVIDGRPTILGSTGRRSRKIDTGGAPTRFGTINASGTWDTGLLRAAVRDLTPGPTPPEEDEDMTISTVWAPDGGHQFVTGTDGTLQHRSFDWGTGWSSWGSLGGQYKGSPTAVMQPDGKMSVAAQGVDGDIYSTTFTWGDGGGWQGPVLEGAWPG